MEQNVNRLMRKGLESLSRRGVRDTARRTVFHFTRKLSERRYVRAMTPPEEELRKQRETVFPEKIRFSVIVPLYNTPADLLRETLESVRAQTWQDWELCLADGSDGEHRYVGEACLGLAGADSRIKYRKLEKNGGISGNSNAALSMASGDYIALFDHDDLLRPDALFEMARAIQEHGADFLYSDEVIFASPRRDSVIGIRFKPDFAPEDLWTNNYICHLTVFRRSLLEQTGGFRSEYDGSQDHDLILRLTDRAKKIIHVPKVLYLWRSVAGSVASDIHTKEYAIDAGRRAVADFLRENRGIQAEVVSTDAFPTMYRVRFPLAEGVRVDAILDTARETGDMEASLRKLREGTSWERVRFLTMEAREGETRRLRLCRAAEQAEGDFLLFLDGIPEAVTPDWIQEMLIWAQLEQIGAVGAKMLFANGRDLRHAGLILGLGPGRAVGRPYLDRYDDHVGFFGQLAVTRCVSAVTDCWMVSRKKFLEAGGFSPEYQDALTEADFCLRLREKGYRNFWTPYAVLQGGKASDFRLDADGERESYNRDREVFLKRWGDEIQAGDPYYHPDLSLDHEDWRLRKK